MDGVSRYWKHQTLAQLKESVGHIDMMVTGASAITPGALDWIGLLLICFILPGIISWAAGLLLRKIGWIGEGDLKLEN